MDTFQLYPSFQWCISVVSLLSFDVLMQSDTCYIFNKDRSDLPDMYTRAQGRAALKDDWGHIRQITTADVTYVM